MKYRIFYSNAYKARDKGWPKQGTIVEINNMDDLMALAESFNESVIMHNKALPNFLSWRYTLWGDECLEEIDEDDIQSEYLVDKPNAEWMTDRWIEIYNGYRE